MEFRLTSVRLNRYHNRLLKNEMDMMSHDELYFKDNPNDENRYLLWVASVVELTEYADSDIPNYINRNQ